MVSHEAVTLEGSFRYTTINSATLSKSFADGRVVSDVIYTGPVVGTVDDGHHKNCPPEVTHSGDAEMRKSDQQLTDRGGEVLEERCLHFL